MSEEIFESDDSYDSVSCQQLPPLNDSGHLAKIVQDLQEEDLAQIGLCELLKKRS